jgi:hypothetical protein
MLCGDLGACPMFERESGLSRLARHPVPSWGTGLHFRGRSVRVVGIARYLLREAGFHVESQVNIPGMGHLDLMVDGRLGIETDGAGFHMDKPSFEEDRRRWNVTTRLGLPTLVVSYSMVKNRPREFVEMVRDTLRSLDRAA